MCFMLCAASKRTVDMLNIVRLAVNIQCMFVALP